MVAYYTDPVSNLVPVDITYDLDGEMYLHVGLSSGRLEREEIDYISMVMHIHELGTRLCIGLPGNETMCIWLARERAVSLGTRLCTG